MARADAHPADGSGSAVPGIVVASSPPSFADGVEGRAPQPIDLTLSRLMRDVYDYDGNGKADGVGRWQPLSADELRRDGIDPASLRNTSSGFYAVIYGDGHGHKVLAYSGTDETKDWVSDYDSPQVSPARVAEILANPEKSTSDTFLFANGKLIAHHKASYIYE